MSARQIVPACLLAACTLGVVQAVVETFVVAVLYADQLLAPAAFFPLQIWDAFAKLYFIEAGWLGLPEILRDFAGPGFTAKLVIGPELIVIGLLGGLDLGFGTALVFLLRPAWAGASPEQCRRRALLAVAAVALAVNLVAWLATVHLPVEPTAWEVLRNHLRNLLHDGSLVAFGVLGLALAVSWPLLARPARTTAVLATVSTLAVLSLAAGSAAGPAPLPAPQAWERSPARGYNIVLISIDSLRADHLGAYGYGRDTSPMMDSWARRGVLFENASSTTAWTLPGHMSMLTGRSLLGHGVVSDDRMLTADVATLAETFQEAGYRTGAIVSAPYVEARYGFDRGFDEYDDHTVSFATNKESYRSVTAPILQEAADAWLSDSTEKPFFLFLHYWDVHYDYIPSPPYDTMFDPDYEGDITGDDFYFNPAVHRNMDPRDIEHLLALYDGEIRLVDDQLAKLDASLERLGVAGNTIVVVTSDHGDEFFEHGRKGHHRTLYDEILRVPFILYVPGLAATKPVVTMETSIIDIMPTLLSLTGIDIPDGVEGADLAPVGFGDSPETDRATQGELYRKNSLITQVSYRRSGAKLIHNFNRRTVEGYNIAGDPGERSNIDTDELHHPAMLAGLRDWMASAWTVFRSRIAEHGVASLEMDRETAERLRSLGYIQ